MPTRDQIKVGVVQPQVRYGQDAPRMVDDAVESVAEAGRQGIDLLVFPEVYPGPITHAVRYEIVPKLAAAAVEHGVAVAAGTTVKADDGEDAYYVAQVVIDEHGSVRGTYRRSHPRSEVYEGVFRSEFWDFEYRAGDELPVFDLGWAKIGIVICSEIYVPEVARILALRGAEICLIPSGGVLLPDPAIRESWHALVRARATENLMFTAATMNLFSPDAQGVDAAPAPTSSTPSDAPGYAMIASPEEVLAVAGPEPGILSAVVDLASLRVMRAKRLPGILKLRRPELASELSDVELTGRTEAAELT